MTKAYFFNQSFRLIDSLFEARPASPILPYYVMFYSKPLGPEVVAQFYNKLPQRVQETEEGQRVKNYLDRSVLLQKGTPIEDFQIEDQKGKTFQFSLVTSKYIILEFWASWCGPCRASHPSMVELHEKYKEKGLTTISISLDEEKKDWLEAIEKDKLTWWNVSDLKGWENTLAKKYKISSVPYKILLDGERKVIATDILPGEIEKMLSKLIQ